MAAEWEGQALDQLNRLTAPHLEKKKATILALVDARLAGRSEESVWKREDTCSRGVWHERWKHDRVIADVLAHVTSLARGWNDGRSLRSLRDAAERLALAAPDAADKAIALMDNLDAAISLRAVFGILDRAGIETAQKIAPGAMNVVLTWGESEIVDDDLIEDKS